MARLIVLALLVGGVYWLMKRVAASRTTAGQRASRSFESTVRCHQCGAYVARRHAIADSAGHRCRVHGVDHDRSSR